MTVDEAIERLREDILDDSVEPYKWSDETLTRLLNNAEREACVRANLIIDSDTTNICIITTMANVHTYDLNLLILRVLNVYNNTTNKPIYATDRDSVDAEMPEWKNLVGIPKFYFVSDTHKITFVPVPDDSYIMNLTVSRLPLTPKEGQESFEIPEFLHEGLLYGAAYQALSMKDINTNRNKDADKFMQKFTEIFGPPKTAVSVIAKQRAPLRQAIRSASKLFGFP